MFVIEMSPLRLEILELPIRLGLWGKVIIEGSPWMSLVGCGNLY